MGQQERECMRTVEQVVQDYKKADEAVKAAEKTRNQYKAELQDIYNAAKLALEIKDQPLYRGG
jgi:hypothetical protein